MNTAAKFALSIFVTVPVLGLQMLDENTQFILGAFALVLLLFGALLWLLNEMFT